MKETRGNKFFGNVLYGVTILFILIAGLPLLVALIPDPLPAVDEIIAIKMSLGFVGLAVISFIIGSCLRMDGSGKEFVDNMSKAGEAVKVAGAARKLVE